MPDMHEFNASIIDEFRANAGKVGGTFEGATMLLLTTTGAKSGKRRTSPLVYLEVDGRLLIFASYGGAPTNPAWYHNVLANPVVTVELGDRQFEAKARVVTGEERDELYARQVEVMPGFGDYEANTSRVIPVVELEPIG